MAQSSVPAAKVIVSDDDPSAATYDVVRRSPLSAIYTVGPQRGLAANRNHALARVSSDYLLFLDDDCRIAEDFLSRALACMKLYEGIHGVGAVVVSGSERRAGSLVTPADQSFLGFQRVPYERPVGLNSVVINSAIFPLQPTVCLGFDERLRYGSEEVDLATRLVARGVAIVYCPIAVNQHMPSPRGRSTYVHDADVSRLYATFKRYAFTERRRTMACAFLLVAPIHTIASGVKRDGLAGGANAMRILRDAAACLISFLRDKPSC